LDPVPVFMSAPPCTRLAMRSRGHPASPPLAAARPPRGAYLALAASSYA
jgi:hypothetical protein